MPGTGDVSLSPRQHEVLVLMSSGVRAKEMAAAPGVAEPTTRNQIRDVLRRLDCHSQLEAVARARQCRLL